MNFDDLQLGLNTDSIESPAGDTWSFSEDGSLQHRDTGILIGELGLRDGEIDFQIDPAHIEVDQTNLLGRGACGVVARAMHAPTQTPLAVKVVRVEDKQKRTQLINDLHALLRISESSFLVQLYAAYVHKDSGCVHVVLELMDLGSLADLQKKVDGEIPENIVALMTVQILEGLKALHINYVVHRDVKPGNILCNSRGAVKLTDFGISKRVGHGEPDVCGTFVGTATHMSPERVLGEDYSFPADIWSVGLCVYELASGSYPYGSISSFPALFDHLCSRPEPRLSAGRYSPTLCVFVAKMLQRYPQKRSTAIELQAHPFLLNNMFQVTQTGLVKWLERVVQGSNSPASGDRDPAIMGIHFG